MRLAVALFALAITWADAQSSAASRPQPNLVDNIDRPLRYRPDGADFVIENGAEFFNRALYGGNTAFRVEGGDKPEFALHLPGRGGNVRLGVRTASASKWLHDAANIITRYRPGSLLYEIRDPLLGSAGVLRLTALAYHQLEGLALRIEVENVGDGIDLAVAYGGVNGERGRRDGDIGTENVPVSARLQLKPEFCRENTFTFGPTTFTLRARAATIHGVLPAGAQLALGDAEQWSDARALLDAADPASRDDTRGRGGAAPLQVVVGRVALTMGAPLFLSLQRIETSTTAPIPAAELPREFVVSERHFAALRTRVAVDTPDPFLDAAVGALNVAADALWDEPQQAILPGAVAWDSEQPGRRGPYVLDALGWHQRARKHFVDWSRQVPPEDKEATLARNEAGLHSEGDRANSDYDTNLVHIDALFRHLAWTGELELARQLWPAIERHFAWERRLYRREFGRDPLPLYEGYAAIPASDTLHYHGGGAMHASAYNYFHNQQAARLARMLKQDPTEYQREAQLLERGMREHLWLPDRGWFGEFKDLLGLQRVHPSAGLWTFYHAMDSDVPTPQEAWQMTRQVEIQIPRLPVRGPGVPEGMYVLATTQWMPYRASINNVVLAEVAHTALGFWQAGRTDEAWRIMKGALLAGMFMGASPGNVGSTLYLDVYRRESQRDFAEGSGGLARALLEGLFGVKPDALVGELRVVPGWPADWEDAALRHPDVSVSFRRDQETDTFVVEQGFARPQSLRLRLMARRDRIASVTIDGNATNWHVIENAMGAPRIEILGPAGARHEVVVRWAGAPIERKSGRRDFARVQQGEMRWWHMAETARSSPAVRPEEAATPAPRGDQFEPLDLSAVFNDRVTQIFRNEYRPVRLALVRPAIPKQGIGGRAGGVNATAEIDDIGLRAAAAKNGGRIMLPNSVVFATPAEADARNVMFTSQWDNYPREASVALTGRARQIFLLMAGSTNPMQSRIDNGEVVVAYTDGSSERLALENPTNWWPIQEDYFIDDFQFRRPEPLPIRVDLKTGRVRVLEMATFKGTGGKVPGGAATVLALPLDAEKELKTLTVRALSNEVVIGLMAATLVR